MKDGEFHPKFLDFRRGIQVGHLEPRQRITQILKASLQARYEEDFLIDRFGRGVYWQWICFLSRSNRLAKPLSSHFNFGCSKFFIQMDREHQIFKAGFHVERGFETPPQGRTNGRIQRDWDWHRFMKSLTAGSGFYKAVARLVREDGFHLQAGSRTHYFRYHRADLPSPAQLKRTLSRFPGDQWAVFQVFYPMNRKEVQASTGPELVGSVLAVFREVAPVMNFTMQVPLRIEPDPAHRERPG